MSRQLTSSRSKRLAPLRPGLRVVSDQPEQNQSMFHVTMSGRAKNIAANGLRCNSKRSIGAPSLDGNCKGRIFLTDAAGVDFWFDRAELFARDKADDFLKEG